MATDYLGGYSVDPDTGDVFSPQRKPTPYDSFWQNAGPGLLDFGAGLYSRMAGPKEAAQRLQQARGPLYDQAANAASGMLTQAGSFNPDAFAANRFNAGEALVAPKQDADLNQLMRVLRAKGMLGAASFEPATSYAAPGAGARTAIDGAVPTVNGQAMNPNIAAFYAARDADRAKRAYASMDQGQQYLDNMVNRAGTLQRIAGNTQDTGLKANDTLPSRTNANLQLLKGGLGVLKDSGILKDVAGRVPGMISGGMDWLGSTIGNFFKTPSFDMGDFGDFNFG